MSNEVLGLVGLGVLLVAIFIGFPIAFTLGALALGIGFVALGPVVFDLAVLQTFSVMRDTVLAAIQFFLFMGFMLEQSGIMERLFTGIQQLLAGLRGSLYLAVMITATIFAAATGIVGSSVTLLGVMAAPSMTKSKYDVRMSAGVITAGGTLGILIPPSVMLIVMGPAVGVPATDLFAAAVLPGLMLSGLFAAWCLLRCWINPALGPALPPEMRAKSLGPVLVDLAIGVAPVIVVLISTLGVILAGLYFGAWASHRTGPALGRPDSGHIVIDEMVAFWIVLVMLPDNVELPGLQHTIAFVLFRFFDIVKPPPIRWLDARINNGFGVMVDDLMAAFYTLLLFALWARVSA